MSEVEKMYENAGIKKQYCGWLDIGDLDTNVQYVRCETKEKYDNYAALDSSDLVQIIPDEVYPPFTAEKQLELIKLLAKTRPIHITFLIDKWVIEGMVRYGKRYDTFEDALSGYINNIWQDLTESEQEQIRSILNGN